MSDPRRLLDDPNASPETKELLGAIGAPTALSAPWRAMIGVRVAKSAALPMVAAKVVSLKAAGLFGVAVAGGASVAALAITTAPAPERPAAPVLAPVVSKLERAVVPPVHVEEAPAAPAPSPATDPRPTARPDTLALEEVFLEQARAAMATPARALSLLHEHERRFPNGELTAERLFLTAQVHARSGNETLARHYAKLLATRFPKSTYLARLRPLLDAPGTTGR